MSGRPRDLGIPVLQALDLVHDDTFGEHLPFQAHVPVHSVVGDYLVEHIRLVHLGALDRIALYHQGGGVREFIDLFLPLVLKRRGADDEYGRHQPGLAEEFRRADGLDRLSKSHLVRDDGLALSEGEADPLLLVRVETGFQKAVQVLVRQFGQKALTVIRILRLRDVVKHIRVAAEVRVEFLRPYDETLQLCHLAWKRDPVGGKIFTRQKPHRGSSDRPYPDTDGAAL